jgi:hypothetical protein
MNAITRVTVILLAAAVTFAQGPTQKEAPSISIIGYVRDSGCVHRFHEVIKSFPNGCGEACVRGGSPLVVLTKNEQVYHPISDVDVRQKLLPFVGKLVKIRVDWTGNDGEGTETYKGYRRDHTIAAEGKPQIQGSSDPSFRGDRARYNPEE